MDFVMIFELIALPAVILGWCAYDYVMTDRALKRGAEERKAGDPKADG